MSDLRFTDLDLSDPVLTALDEMGYEKPTPVQATAIPLAITGQDLLVQSQTGTGKTAAFAIPVIEILGHDPKGIQVLGLCPTRELAKQVAQEFGRLGKHMRVETAAVYGGASLEKQVAEMRFANVVIGTPGRVLDHLRRRTLKLNNLQVLILDEADEMLSMGFAQELAMIMSFVPKQRQTLLFSATVPPDIKRYAKRHMNEPEFLSLVEENVGADDVEHHYYMVAGVGRTRDLVQVIEYENPDSAIIFTNTRKDSEIVARNLKRQGYDAEFLHGDLAQRDRERIMKRTKDKTLRFLVATDIAARGIDISELSHVINYVLPESPESYIHRTGRTGRAGQKGTAISLIGPREIGVYYYLKRIYNVALQERSVPTQAEIDLRRDERRTEALIKEILEAVGPIPQAEMRDQTMRLLERDDAVETVSALLYAFRNPAQGAPTVGGVLAEVPKPDRIEAGSRPMTLAGVANRVAIVQSEFRGLPGKQTNKAKSAAKKPAPQKAPSALPAEAEPVAKPAPVSTPKPKVPVAQEEPKVAEPKVAEPKVAEQKVAEPKVAEPKVAEPTPAVTQADLPPRRRRRRRTRGQDPSTSPTVVEIPKLEVSAPVVAVPKEAPKVTAPTAAKAPRVDVAPPEISAEVSPTPAEDVPQRRLFINVGKRDDITAEALLELLADLGGLFPEDFSGMTMRARHSFVEIPAEFSEDLIAAVDGETVGDKTIRVEFARDDR